MRVLAAVARLLEDLGAVLQIEDRLPFERSVKCASEHMGEAEFERARQQRLAMSVEQVIAYSYEQLLHS